MNAVARKGRAGVGIIRRLLEERGDVPDGTVLERRMWTLLATHGIPTPVAQQTVLDGHGQFVGVVDFAYPELKYVIEVDGFESHSALREFRHDRVRQNDLIDLGWTVHRFTWTEVDQLSPRVADRIRHRRFELLGTLEHARGA
jgi:very-short-patch-repair endonuclease